MNEVLQTLLLEKRLIFVADHKREEDEKKRAYFNSYLLINFGIELENPEEVSQDVLIQIDGLLHLNVPKSFYESPQDTKYFSCEELLIEQIVSYWLGYGTDIKRIELFKKALPKKFVVGDEIKLRHFRVIFEEEAKKVLAETMNNYLDYRRPFSEEEKERFIVLAHEGYFDISKDIACKDNIFPLLPLYPELAARIDKKDLVKFSLDSFGERREFRFDKSNEEDREAKRIILAALPLVKDCPLSKRQAKLFNKMKKEMTGVKGKEDNSESVYKKMLFTLKNGGPVIAAEYLAKQGSLLERNLVFLLSRCEKDYEIKLVLEQLSSKNPAVLMQLYYTILSDKAGKPRTFIYRSNGRNVSYTEDEEETEYRKSTLTSKQREIVARVLLSRIHEHYMGAESLGKIYVSEEFKKIAVPLSTEATGKGVDVLPSGSRIKFDGNFIRIFCHWNGPRDIDASLACLKELNGDYSDNDSLQVLSWQTYYYKPLNNAALCSGDDTSDNGAEYQDIDIKGLMEDGWRYVISGINGYWDDLSIGTIIQGIQIKNEINTKPWDPKNIEFQMSVKADARSFVGFAVDLEAREIVMVNAITKGGNIFNVQQLKACSRYLSKHFLDINMYDILRYSGQLVATPEEADIVFDREYSSKDKKVVRPFDVDSLIAIVNRK
ncbi:MAG: hypothetical protein K6B65_01220 [Bacilli bacterium]|nr:hypothetical protein [Bacilli bacterium]